MAYDLQINDNENLILVSYLADTSYQDRIDVLNELVVILNDKPEINVLVDTRNASSNMSVEQQLEYGNSLAANRQFFGNNKTAIIATRGNNPHPVILAGAYADGFDKFCEFDNEKDAIAWLKGEIR